MYISPKTTFTLCCRSKSTFQKSVLLENCLLLYWTMPETCNVSKNELGLSSKIGFDNFLVVFPLKISKSPPSSSFQKETMLAERISAQIRILFLLLNTQIFSVPTFCIFVVMLRVRVVLSLKRRANTRKRIH